MDRQFWQGLVAAVFTPEREATAYDVDLGDRTLAVARPLRGGPVTLALAVPGAEEAGPDLEWAWLEASWLRRLDDGVVATSDADGRLGFGMVLPQAEMSAERFERAVAALDAASRPVVETPPADAPVVGSDMVWLKL